MNPIPTQELSTELNQYDVGLFILPPTTYNYCCALPNKLFEFIQARIAIAVSPNPEMKAVIDQNNLGVVASGYTSKSMAEVLKSLNQEQVHEFKWNAHRIAERMSSRTNSNKIKEIVRRLISES